MKHGPWTVSFDLALRFLFAAAAAAALGACPDDSGGGADTSDVAGDTSVADTGGDVSNDTTVTDTSEVDAATDTTEADTTESDTAVVDTVDDTTEADSVETDTAEDTVETDTVEGDTVEDTAEGDTVEPDTVEDTVETDTTVAVSCEGDSCSGHGACSVVDNAISCDCEGGYSGDVCDSCDSNYQDENSDGTCEPGCALAECGTNTDCAIDGDTGLAECSCSEGFIDLDEDGDCVESVCGDGYVDVDEGEECDPADGVVDIFCVDCVVNCLPYDDNATDDNATSPIVSVPVLPDDNATDDNTTLATYELSNGCYARLDDNLTWYEAGEACEALGAHLVELDDELENSSLINVGAGYGWMNLQGTWDGGPNDAWESGAPVELEPGYVGDLPDENSTLSDPYCFRFSYTDWYARSCDEGYGYAICERETCGDGILSANEECDDGNLEDGDGCDSNCTVTGCGNRIITSGEDCDDGDDIDTNACPNDCQLPACALLFDEIAASYTDSTGCYVQPDTYADWATAAATCSDAGLSLATVDDRGDAERLVEIVGRSLWIDGTDAVADGTWLRVDGSEQTYLPFAGAEPNGEGDENCLELGSSGYFNDLRCTSSRPFVCVDAACGDGGPDDNEECDDGNDVEGDGCDTNCRVSGCGNGIKDSTEECDDGNLDDDDGCTSACTLPCGGATTGASGAWEYEGYCYLTFSEAPATPEDAEAACVSLGLGAHLVTVTSDAENAFVFGISGSGWAIGYNDIATEGTFVWFSGASSDYTSWGGIEPNNSGGSDGPGEDCTFYRSDGNWNDARCTNKGAYICECPQG